MFHGRSLLQRALLPFVPCACGAMTMGGSDSSNKGVFGVMQYPANDPPEDRFSVQRLDVVGGWWFSLFDGHGGWQCSDYVSKTLHHNLAIELGNRLGFGHEENENLGGPKDSGAVFEGKVHERLVSGALVAAAARRARLGRAAGCCGGGRGRRAGHGVSAARGRGQVPAAAAASAAASR
jgi:hypothetical protein